jgi:hypothetical protein
MEEAEVEEVVAGVVEEAEKEEELRQEEAQVVADLDHRQ